MQRTVIKAGRLIDGTGAAPREDVAVVIEDGKVKAIVGRNEAGDFINDQVTVIDAGDATVMPGLWNSHVHLSLKLPFPEFKTDVEPTPFLTMRCLNRALEALKAGVTSIRSVGESKHIDLYIKRAVQRGLIVGPNIFGAGEALTVTGGHSSNSILSIEVDGPEEFRKGARKQLKAQADLVKMFISGGMASPGGALNPVHASIEEMRAAVEVAHNFGKHTAVHSSSGQSIQDAVAAGVDCLEHGYAIDVKTIDVMDAAGSYFCPTLLVTNCGDYLERHGAPPWQIEKQKEAALTHFDGFSKVVDRENIKIIAGTDLLPTDEVDNTIASIREIELLVEGGLSNMRALQAATSVPAELCGTGGYLGTLAPGMQADLVIMPKDPLENIKNLRNIKLVMWQGKVINSTLASHRYPCIW